MYAVFLVGAIDTARHVLLIGPMVGLTRCATPSGQRTTVNSTWTLSLAFLGMHLVYKA